MDLVSIIVPVYNVEKHIRECVNSLLSQTYKNIEIILIDDGSTDNSGSICDTYALNDNRIKVFHKKNGGLGDARNFGIDNSSGTYLMFVDSDDYLDVNCVNKTICFLKQNSLDIACFCGIKFKEQQILEICFKTKFSSTIVDGPTVALEILKDSIGSQIVVGAYNKELFNKVRFPINRLYEDIPTTYKVFFQAKKVGFIDEPFYHYRMNENSISFVYNPLVPYHLFLGFLDHYNFAISHKLDVVYECLILTAHFATSTCFHFYTWRNAHLKNKVEVAENFLISHRKTLLKDKTMLKSRRFMMKTFLKSRSVFKTICFFIRLFKWKEE